MIIEIATPMYGGQCFGNYHQSIVDFINLCSKKGISVMFNNMYNESLIQRARNTIASSFVERGTSNVLLFIDSDISFDAEKLLDMVLEDRAVIGAVTPLKHIDFDKIVKSCAVLKSTENADKLGSFYNFNNLVNQDDGENLMNGISVEVDRIGTGVMAIKREVLMRMKEEVEEYLDDNLAMERVKRYNFFPVTIEYDAQWGGNRMMSEDYNFCNKWKQLGGKVYAKTGIVKGHSGFYEYKGDFAQELKVYEAVKKLKTENNAH